MALIKRNELPALFKEVEKGAVSPVYLVTGERFLCRQAAEQLVDILLPADQREIKLQNIDGDREDVNRTVHLLRTYSLFGGRQVVRVWDSKLFFSKQVSKTMWQKATGMWEEKKPDDARRYIVRMLHSGGLAVDEESVDVAALSDRRWRELFGFAKPSGDLGWVKQLFDSAPGAVAVPGGPEAGSDGSEQILLILQGGLPTDNILIIVAEAVDKRKKLYKYIEKHGVILDLTVEGGSSRKAVDEQERVLTEIIQQAVADLGKKIDRQAVQMLLKRVGFHPVAAAMEAEKLALYAGDQDHIDGSDVDAIVGRTREDALYELTGAVGQAQLEQSFAILARLLESGVHSLAVLATLRNFFKKMLVIRSFQESPEPSYAKGMAFAVFQKRYLPALKEAHSAWLPLWKGHPYALYMSFGQAEKYSVNFLKKALGMLLEAEYRLKSSSVPDRLVMENLLLELTPAP